MFVTLFYVVRLVKYRILVLQISFYQSSWSLLIFLCIFLNVGFIYKIKNAFPV